LSEKKHFFLIKFSLQNNDLKLREKHFAKVFKELQNCCINFIGPSHVVCANLSLEWLIDQMISKMDTDYTLLVSFK
jgi:hypothetical protein